MKILLVCAAGMSTSLVVAKMKKFLKPEEADWIITAIPAEDFVKEVDNYDVVLLGPQLKFKKAMLEEIAKPKGIPLDVINMTDYGTIRGDKILEFAKEIYNKKNS